MTLPNKWFNISLMIIKPKIRGFICITAHPDGCEAHIQEQVNYVRTQKEFSNAPKRVLILGASTGYGLASRIVAAVAGKADTFGVFYERPGEDNKPASPGWYNSVAFEKAAKAEGVKAYAMNGDAFSADFKKQVVQALKATLGQVDCVVYSLAAPRRTDSKTGEVYRSVLKPIGQSFSGKTVNTDKAEVSEVTLEPANDEEVRQTVKVMGGEDWEEWMHVLAEENLLAEGATTIAYSYIGPKVTWPIYKDGTIGKAKEHLAKTAEVLNQFLKERCHGKALISVNKAVVTQASSAIPIVPLYTSVLFKVMKEKHLDEDCIQQMYRLFAGLFDGQEIKRESETCVRLDDREFLPEVQAEVEAIWKEINTENLRQLSDFDGYQKKFLHLFGFDFDNVKYDAETQEKRNFEHLIS